jgi:hypothetical protein
MKQSIILGIGTGRCGMGSLAKVLNQQSDAVWETRHNNIATESAGSHASSMRNA